MKILKKFYRAIFKRGLSKTTSLLLFALLGTLILGILIETAAAGVGFLLTRPPDAKSVSYSKFIELSFTQDALDKKILLREQTFFSTRQVIVVFIQNDTGQKGWTYFDISPEPGISPEEWLRQLQYDVTIEIPFPWGYVLFSVLQITGMSITQILMMGVFIWFIAGGGITKAIEEMSVINASRKLAGQKVTLDDVAGIEPEKAIIRERIEFMKSTEDLKEVGAVPPRGILLHGPPGTGKSLVARAIIHEAGLPYFWISGSDVSSPLIGVANQKLDTLFDEAFRAAPAIIVIDEFDSAAPKRAGLGPFENKERTNIVNKILSLNDRIEKEGIPVYVIGITNFFEALDPAVIREGRMDDKIEIPLPMTIEARKAILTVHTTRPKPKPLAPDVNLESIARQTFGFSGAFLATLANKAALRAVSQKRKVITQQDFEESIELVLMGPIRELKLTDKELEIVTHHEAGHAFADHVLPGIDPPQIFSLMARGKALGFCWAPQRREYFLQTEERLRSLIKSALAGYAIEKLLYRRPTTGPHDDLKKAAYLAHDMVFEYGMSKLGPVSFSHQGMHLQMWSPETIRDAEKEVINILRECEKEIEELLSLDENKEKLLRLAAELLKEKRLNYNDIVRIIGEPPKEKLAQLP